MTSLQKEILTFLATCREPQTAAWIVDRTALAARRHQAGPNGNGGGGDWRQRAIGSVLAGMQKRGWVVCECPWPKTWSVSSQGRAALGSFFEEEAV